MQLWLKTLPDKDTEDPDEKYLKTPNLLLNEPEEEGVQLRHPNGQPHPEPPQNLFAPPPTPMVTFAWEDITTWMEETLRSCESSADLDNKARMYVDSTYGNAPAAMLNKAVTRLRQHYSEASAPKPKRTLRMRLANLLDPQSTKPALSAEADMLYKSMLKWLGKKLYDVQPPVKAPEVSF